MSMQRRPASSWNVGSPKTRSEAPRYSPRYSHTAAAQARSPSRFVRPPISDVRPPRFARSAANRMGALRLPYNAAGSESSTTRSPASVLEMVHRKHEAHMRSQQDSAGGLRHLITLDGLTRDAVTAILDRAETYRRLPGQPPYEARELAGVTLANLFFEPSTRPRASPAAPTRQ